MCISVDLPDPEGPMTETYSPSSMVRVIPPRAATAPDLCAPAARADDDAAVLGIAGAPGAADGARDGHDHLFARGQPAGDLGQPLGGEPGGDNLLHPGAGPQEG